MKAQQLFCYCLSMSLVACEPSQQSIESSNLMKGDYRDAGVTYFNYSTGYLNTGDLEVILRLRGGKPIKMIISPYEGLKELNGQGTVLSKNHIKVLREGLTYVLRSESRGPKKTFLMKMLGFLSLAPVGVPLMHEIFLPKLESEGIKCIARGRSYQARWTLSKAVGEALLKVDSKTCYGKCSYSCDEGNNIWTQVCLNLDACNLSVGETNSVQCQDEWRKSADDWTVGHLFGCEIMNQQ